MISVFAAVRDAADALALVAVDEDRRLTWAELAARVEARLGRLGALPAGVPVPVVADNRIDTVVTLLALAERRLPALLVHPRLTAPERAVIVADAARAAPLPDVYADALAVLYTSGTTGKPRGAVLRHDAFEASAAASAENLGWQPDDRWLACMPLAHVGGLSILTRSLLARRTMVLASRFDPAGWPALVARERVTLASLVPTMLARLLEEHPAWTPPPHLRAVLLGGAAASHGLLARAGARRVPTLCTYGLTEACSQVTTTPYATRYEPIGQGVGRPLPGVEVRVHGERIQVRGPTLMAGYLGAPPLPPGAWLDTGDLGEIDAAGRLHVHARRTDLIVSGGENVYPAEIEQVLETCPGVAAAWVFGVPDDTWGQIVAAAIVPDGAPPPDDVVRAHVGARLAPHKRPRRLCWLPALPVTPAGKLDRRAVANVAPNLRPL
jgi:O-succinylbenzoic acid--CoA ligase